MITVVDYDPRWPAVFDALRAKYEAALVGVPVVGIEHVGSTSVPGLAAKPVIDIDIVVAAPQVDAALAAMANAGFRSRGELGIEDRWALRAPPDTPRTNTYVVVAGSLALRNHLGVRDVLRNDAALRDEYASLKRALAQKVDNGSQYVEAKSSLLSLILARAGLSDEERKLIEEANRAT